MRSENEDVMALMGSWIGDMMDGRYLRRNWLAGSRGGYFGDVEMLCL